MLYITKSSGIYKFIFPGKNNSYAFPNSLLVLCWEKYITYFLLGFGDVNTILTLLVIAFHKVFTRPIPHST